MFLLRELRWVVALLAIIAAIAQITLGGLSAWPLWLCVLIAAFLIRERPRRLPSEPLAILSPVDGRVVDVQEVHDPYLDREALRVRLRQHPLGELGVRAPTEGKLMRKWWPGALEEAPDSLQEGALWIQTDEEDDVIVALDATGPIAFVRCSVQTGERAGQGRRCGLAGFARRVDLYLPANSRALLEAGARVRAGVSAVAALVHD
jgi:phosphatidylserine decarboxylase